MAAQPKKEKKDGEFMVKVATFIVDRRNLFFLLFGIALIFSVVSMNWVKVENAMSAYLPDTTETRQGLDCMEEQFIMILSILVDTFFTRISVPKLQHPEIHNISAV